MKLEDIISNLQEYNTQNTIKDNLINRYNGLFKIITKFINDDKFINSDSYYIFKNNYLNEFIKLYEEIQHTSVKIEPSITMKIQSKSKEQTKIINSFNPYLPRSSNSIPKIKLEKTIKQNVYILNIPLNALNALNSLNSLNTSTPHNPPLKVLFNPLNSIIYNMDYEEIGILKENILTMKDHEPIEIKTISEKKSSYKSINSDYVIM